MKRSLLSAVILAALTLPLGAAAPQNTPKDHPGPLAEGAFLLNTGWKVQPAGDQIPVDTLPLSTALSSDGKYLLVLNGGARPPSVSVIDLSSRREIGRTPLPDAWLGLAVAPSGDRVYVGGGSTGKIFELSLAPTGALARTREFVVKAPPAKKAPFIGDVALSPDARALWAADLEGDSIAQINLQSGQMTDRWKTGHRPYRILVSPDGVELFISSWADGSVYEHQSASGVSMAKFRVAPHPTDMLWLNKPAPAEENGPAFPARLFVAASNTNNVYSFGVTADAQLTMLETINIATSSMHPLGMTPSALAVDKQGAQLYIACSDANAVAVADISGPHARVLGFLPTGSYPTALRSLPNETLAIANGRGNGASVNSSDHSMPGTVSLVPRLNPQNLAAYTKTVSDNAPYRDDLIYGPLSSEQTAFFSHTSDHPSPIQHVIYVMAESGTYDQVLGDLPNASGDKSLVSFGEQVTPNLHQLARDYVLYDNFYVNGDTSAAAENWAAAAIAPDFTAKLSPTAANRRAQDFSFRGGEPANSPPAGYLWNNALQAGLSISNYGAWVTNIPLPQVAAGRQVQGASDPSLMDHTDLNYRGVDPAYPDVERAKEFIREWKQFDAAHDAPQLAIVRLGHAQNDPAAAADTDYALGLLADAVSHSGLWPTTAIFVTSAGTLEGADHVDIHRAPVWILSPFTRRAAVDSAMYNQSSILRTLELIEGLRPMTHFDAAATPLFGSFTRQPDPKPFTAIASKAR